MAKGYWIAHNQISDVDAYEAYKIAAVPAPVSYTHLRAHETKANLVCRLLLEKKNKTTK